MRGEREGRREDLLGTPRMALVKTQRARRPEGGDEACSERRERAAAGEKRPVNEERAVPSQTQPSAASCHAVRLLNSSNGGAGAQPSPLGAQRHLLQSQQAPRLWSSRKVLVNYLQTRGTFSSLFP